MKVITRNEFLGSIPLSIISIFITTQPGFVATNLKFLACRKIGDKNFSLADSNIDCEDEYYKSTVLPINITLLLLVSLLIPLGLFLKLLKYKKSN